MGDCNKGEVEGVGEVFGDFEDLGCIWERLWRSWVVIEECLNLLVVFFDRGGVGCEINCVSDIGVVVVFK